LAVAGRVEVIGQLEHAIRRVLFQMQRRPVMQFVVLFLRQSFQQRFPDAIVHERGVRS